MATRICYGRCTGLAPANHIQLVTVCIQNNTVLGVGIALDRKGCNCSIHLSAHRCKVGFFLYFGHDQIDGCIIVIALRVIGRHSNYADCISTCLVELACRDRVRCRGNVLSNESIVCAIPHVHVVLESCASGRGGLVPRNLEAITNFNLLIVCGCNGRSRNDTKRNKSNSCRYFPFTYFITIFVKRICLYVAATYLIKHMTTCVLNITTIGIFVPINHIQLISIKINDNTVFGIKITL